MAPPSVPARSDETRPALPQGRRGLLRAALAAPALYALSSARSSASVNAIPDLPELEWPALMLRAPTRAFLIGGAKAGPRCLAAGEDGVIILSDDRGASWTQARVPVSVTLTCLGFATPLVGWAAGGFGVILRTGDGGKTWEKQFDGRMVITLMQASAASFAASRPAGDRLAAHALRRAEILAAQGPNKPFLSLLAISEQEVIVFGAYRMVMRSTDGGQSWMDWSLHVQDPYAHNLYDAAVIGGDIYLAAETGLVFCAKDGGRNFAMLGQPGQGTFFGICDAGAGGILAYGVAGGIYLSNDGGQSWSPSSLESSSSLTAIIKLDSGRLIAGDETGSLFSSLDHGRSFTRLLHNPMILISDILEADAGNLLLLTDIGVVPLSLTDA